jgi:predicted transposase YdaD
MEFDATLKTMLEAGPADWPRLLGLPGSDVEVIDADASTVTGAADKVLRVNGPNPYILHLEFQTGPDASKPRKLNLYNAILEDRTGLPVQTAFILLRPKAVLRVYDGVYRCTIPDRIEPYRTFRYDVVRVWEIPPEQLLRGLGTLPLAPIGAVAESELPAVLREMKVRIGKKSPRSLVDQLWASAFVLMGLRYEPALVSRLTQEVLGMDESTTYQFILSQGAVREVRKILLRLGNLQFGEPAGAKAQAKLAKIEDLNRLEDLTDKLLTANSWDELLGLPSRKNRRRS